MLADFRFALRTLTKSPGLSVVIVVSLALGIGANTVVFSWLNAALLRPLPGVNAAVVGLEPRNSTGTYLATSWLDYLDLVAQLPSLPGLAAQRPRTFTLGDNDRGDRVWGEFVSGNFFTTLGVRPALGRFFRADEAVNAGAAPVAVISDQFWHHEFGGRADAIGRTLKLNGRTLTVIGVTPADFVGGFQGLAFDVWVPVTMITELMPATQELTNRGIRSVLLLAPAP